MSRNVRAIVEEQIKHWHAAQQARERTHQGALHRSPNVVTLSTAVGVGGTALAHAVGDRLGIPVYDREIVSHIARTAHVHERTVEALDERAIHRVDDHLAALFRERGFDQTDYLRLLTRTVGALWEHGPCVIVGHGGAHIVSRDHALAVRVVGDLEDRVRNVIATRNLAEAEAGELVTRVDAERASFHRHHFHAAVDDPLAYDLVLNVSRLPRELAVMSVVEAYRFKFKF